MATFTPTQKVMAIAPKCTGFVSLCSSTFLIQHILRNDKRRNLTYHRLLLGMSISDFFGSLMCFLSTWPIPKGEAYLAVGTVETCAAQGFFDQTAALCTPMYNMSLAIYYLLVIVRGWKQRRVTKVEKYLHTLPIVAGFGTGIASLVMKLYNAAGWVCWLGPGLPNHPERHNPDYGIYRLAFMYAEVWFIICFLAGAMVVVYVHVLKQEKKLDKYQRRWMRQSLQKVAFAQKKRAQSKKIRNQAFLYVGCMYMTWFFGSISRMMQFAGKRPPDAINVLFATFYPLQGFSNLVVYMSPHIMHGKWNRPAIAFLKRKTRTLAPMGRKKDSTDNKAENTTLNHDQSRVGTMSSIAAPNITEGETEDDGEHKVSSWPEEASVLAKDRVDAEVSDADGNIGGDDDDNYDDNELNTRQGDLPPERDAIEELAYIIELDTIGGTWPQVNVRRSMIAMEELAYIIEA